MSEVPDFQTFRYVVDHIPKRRDSVLVKLIYLGVARVSEVVTKATKSDLRPKKKGEGGTSKAYGKYLTYEFSDYTGQTTLGEYIKAKALLLKFAVAKRKPRKKKDLFYPKTVALPCDPKYEPWTEDLLEWIRDSGDIRFHLVRQSVSRIVRNNLQILGTGVHTHSLRHWRITHLLTEYGFTPPEISAVTGWTLSTGYGKMGQRISGQMETYVHLAWRNYFPKLLKPLVLKPEEVKI